MTVLSQVAEGCRRHARYDAVAWLLTSTMLVGAVFAGTGCSPSSLVDVQSPSTAIDPSTVNTASAAAQLRIGALLRMTGALGSSDAGGVIPMSGFMTDELASNAFETSSNTGDDRNTLNSTIGKNRAGYGYDAIQGARVHALQARQALQLYASNTPSVPRAWQGEMAALEGYTLIWFAELYCSGIPLTSAPLTGPQVPTRGFTTEEILTKAIALFDSAAVDGTDSARFVNLALVGKARALLDLGQFEEADSVAQHVPTDFVYWLQSVDASSSDGSIFFVFPSFVSQGRYRVQDQEGGNGLVWSTDPRVAVVTVDTLTGTMLWPAKYNVDPTDGLTNLTVLPQAGIPARLADGLEARLIQAEAALARGDGSWLTTLNTLRATCVGTAACAPIPGIATNALPALADPGTPDARLDTLMKERAMWLYLTGHREGDLRRMARLYGRDPDTLWPTGQISGPAFPPLWSQPTRDDGLSYGVDVVYGPDVNEQARNPLYSGCSDTNP